MIFKIPFLIISAVLVAVIALYLDWASLVVCGFPWFPRAGALWVVVGVVFESKYILRTRGDGQTTFYGTLNMAKTEDENTEIFSIPNIKTHAGVVVIVLGTLVWGFGDILSNYIH